MTVVAPSFLWYDLETSGIDPRWHRILQFAAVRTDTELNEIEEPVAHYVKLPIDVLPDPAACVVTGLTPQLVNEKGLPELEAYVGVNARFSVPGTCVAGFNNLRFDDEFIRFSFYRHLIDPYAREWRGGNSRWDLIDLVRAAGALRREGIEWPEEEGLPVYSLEALTTANRLEHDSAHDALSDVRATLGLARLVRTKHRRLFDYYLTLRDKSRVRRLMDWRKPQICVHVSGRLGRERWNVAPVLPLCPHPSNANSVVVVDLGRDVGSLLAGDIDTIRRSLFTKGDPERPPLKEVRLNRVPFVAPMSVMRAADHRRLRWDVDLIEARAEKIRLHAAVRDVVRNAYERDKPRESVDVDAALYDGLPSDADRAACGHVVAELLADRSPRPPLAWADARLDPLEFRLRARRSLRLLSAGELARWRDDVRARLTSVTGPWMTLPRFRREIDGALRDGRGIAGALLRHADDVQRWLDERA